MEPGRDFNDVCDLCIALGEAQRICGRLVERSECYRALAQKVARAQDLGRLALEAEELAHALALEAQEDP